MIFYIGLALINGAIVSMSRTINGRLSTQIGPFQASLTNHVVGFLLLSLMLCCMGAWKLDGLPNAPMTAYLGGFFGAFFVAVNSYVFPRLGAMNGALLVIAGQMIAAVLIDYGTRNVGATMAQWLGVFIILSGVYLTRMSNMAHLRRTSRDEVRISS